MSKATINDVNTSMMGPCNGLAVRLDRLIQTESNMVANSSKARTARLEARVTELENELANLTAIVTALAARS